MKPLFLFLLIGLVSGRSFSQVYPTFGPEKSVSISGLTFDAMEPFISPDGNTLFYNSLNSGGNTNLYYATRIDDTTFTHVGLVGGTFDPSPDHLDAVASLDSLNHFYWVSLRNFPNLQRSDYTAGSVNNISQTHGDFNIFTPGWIIIDAAINLQGDLLFYCNGFFGPTFTECGAVPCEARLGVAQFVNDSTFSKLINSDGIFSNVNDTNYIVYAPQVTRDGLELYFTRILDGTINSEICVSVRSNVADTFSLPQVIHSNLGFLPEAASPTRDQQMIYYHQKDSSGIFRMYLRYKTGTTDVNAATRPGEIRVFPNPTQGTFSIELPDPATPFTVWMYSATGEEVIHSSVSRTFDISDLPNGIYFLVVRQGDQVWTTKIVLNSKL